MSIAKKTIGVAAVFAAGALLMSCDGASQSASKTNFDPENEVHQSSYVVGNDFGRRLKDIGADLDIDIVFMAMKEVMNDVPTQFSDSAMAAINARFSQELRDRDRLRRQKLEEDNLAAAMAFLEKNKANEGVITTESGLQYIVLTEGTGARPGINDRVRVHYHGMLTDGTVFDSSVDRGEPVAFAVTGVIRGWTEMLQLMNVGGKVKAFIPPELAYGRRGARAPIGPNMALIFDIELLEIEK